MLRLSDHDTIYGGNNTDGLTWEGKTSTDTDSYFHTICNTGFYEYIRHKILEGRDFDTNR